MSNQTPFSSSFHEFINVVINHSDLRTDTKGKLERVTAILSGCIVEILIQIDGKASVFMREVNGQNVHVSNKLKRFECTRIQIDSLIGQNINEIGHISADFVTTFSVVTNFSGNWDLSFAFYLGSGDELSGEVVSPKNVNLEHEPAVDIITGRLEFRFLRA